MSQDDSTTREIATKAKDRSPLGAEREEKILQAGIDRGLIHPEGLELLERMLERFGPRLGALIGVGRLDVEVVRALETDPQAVEAQGQSGVRRSDDSTAKIQLDSTPALAPMTEPAHAPEEAGPPTTHGRGGRHGARAAVAIAWLAFVGMLAALAAATSLWMRAKSASSEADTRAAIDRVATALDRIETRHRLSMLLPLHDAGRDRAEIAAITSQIEADLAQAGGTAAAAPGPGMLTFWRARALRAQGDQNGALAHVLKAWEEGNRSPEVGLMTGALMAEIYREQTGLAATVLESEPRAAFEREATRLYGEPAAKYLQAATDLAAPHGAFARGLIAFCRRDYTAAMQEAHAAAETTWFYEARMLEGEAKMGLACAEKDKGEYEQAKLLMADSEALFRQAIAVGQSDPAGYRSLGILLALRMSLAAHSTGEDISLFRRNAVEALQQALAANPDSAVTQRTIAVVHRMAAQASQRRNEDPLPSLELARLAAEKAIELDTGTGIGWALLGDVWRARASHDALKKLDASSSLASAKDHYKKAQRVGAGSAYAEAVLHLIESLPALPAPAAAAAEKSRKRPSR